MGSSGYSAQYIVTQDTRYRTVVDMGDSQNKSCGCKESGQQHRGNTAKTQEAEAELMTFEGGSDVFTSNRHALHNNEAKSFNFLKFRTEDDAPFFRPTGPASSGGNYVSATVPVEREGCERVSALMMRSNFAWLRHALALGTAGFLVFNVNRWAKSDGERRDQPSN